MSPAGALKVARAAGIELALDGDDLVLNAASAPPAAVLDALSRHKAEIVVLLRPAEDGWSAEDWQVFFDERAGIVEFDGGRPRPEAEAQAFAFCVVEWLNHNPERSPAGRCLGCGDREHAHDPLLPYGAEPNGHVWLHSRCWPACYEVRKAKAVSALTTMGISALVVRPMKRDEQSKHLPSNVTRESRTAKNQFAFRRQMNGGRPMSNIITGRQLRAARILAGLTQKQLAKAVGVHERAARYWELKEDRAPTSTPNKLEKIETVLRDHGVIVFTTPTAGVRLTADVDAPRAIRDQS